jgi:hypothetical protein
MRDPPSSDDQELRRVRVRASAKHDRKEEIKCLVSRKNPPGRLRPFSRIFLFSLDKISLSRHGELFRTAFTKEVLAAISLFNDKFP